MATEIERKFLVSDTSVVDGVPGAPIRQGYLSRVPDRTVRIRRAGDRAWLTVKGANSGRTRAEWEWEIAADDADAMLALCDGPLIEKTRHLIAYGGRTWEVDVFGGPNAGLVMAEIELESDDAEVSLPSWIGPEVTDDPRYYNSALSVDPISNWPRGTRPDGP